LNFQIEGVRKYGSTTYRNSHAFLRIGQVEAELEHWPTPLASANELVRERKSEGTFLGRRTKGPFEKNEHYANSRFLTWIIVAQGSTMPAAE
jgi:hypothetical protein